jgi:plasmid stabilization system protein ParE
MTKPVYWTENARKNIFELADYLLINWGIKLAEQYLQKIEYLIVLISDNPKLFPLVNPKLKIRKCVISKHNSIYYKEKRHSIDILNILDNRQIRNNPKL